jgi:hypothetical protein
MAFTTRISLIDDYVEAGVDVVRLWARWLQQQPELVTRVQTLGPRVWVTTGGLRGEALNRILELGVQGVITDYPEDILKLQPLIELPPELAAASSTEKLDRGRHRFVLGARYSKYKAASPLTAPFEGYITPTGPAR